MDSLDQSGLDLRASKKDSPQRKLGTVHQQNTALDTSTSHSCIWPAITQRGRCLPRQPIHGL